MVYRDNAYYMGKETGTTLVSRTGWLRAAVPGANDGIMSTGSLLLGVISAEVPHDNIVMVGIAGVIAGAMSMATGEYISVSSQADLEQHALQSEKKALSHSPERDALTQLYCQWGLPETLARDVALKITEKEALNICAREKLGLSDAVRPVPVIAAFSSAASFITGAVVPLLFYLAGPAGYSTLTVVISTIVSLILPGSLASFAGKAPVARGTLRVLFWSSLAMSISWGAGSLFNALP